MSVQSLVPQPAIRLPIAHMHPVFDTAEVERKLQKLRDRHAGRDPLQVEDLPAGDRSRSRIGFLG